MTLQHGDLTSAMPLSAADALHYAATRAMLAPSVHNTQPWQFVIREGVVLEIRRDPSRRLAVLDPRGRQMTISCGCALFNARAALASLGYDAVVERLPDPDDPDLIARVMVPTKRVSWLPIGILDESIDQRHTNRRAFLEEPVTEDVVYDLVRAAAEEGGIVVPIVDPAELAAVAELSHEADLVEADDPAYLDEVRRWTTDDPHRADGLYAASIPYRGAGTVVEDAVPVRAFDSTGVGWLPASSHSGVDQCLLLLATDQDTELGWIRCGEAIERVWLELTKQSYSAGPLPQVVELNTTNAKLRIALNLSVFPQLVMRVGHAADVEPARRRPRAEVLTEA